MLTVGNVSAEFSVKIRAKHLGSKQNSQKVKYGNMGNMGKIWTPASGELCRWEAEASGHLPQVVVPELISVLQFQYNFFPTNFCSAWTCKICVICFFRFSVSCRMT